MRRRRQASLAASASQDEGATEGGGRGDDRGAAEGAGAQRVEAPGGAGLSPPAPSHLATVRQVKRNSRRARQQLRPNAATAAEADGAAEPQDGIA